MKELLLLSNSTNPGEDYFTWPLDITRDFLREKGVTEITFVPFAGVSISYDEYTSVFGARMESIGIKVVSIHDQMDMVKAIKNAQAIAVGGGNTFALLNRLYKEALINQIQERVGAGIPYIGWSAGSNMTCPHIYTTNDMPIVEPPSFKALNLIPYQINPHYTDKKMENHGGESRDLRLKEFMIANPETHLLCLPEGAYVAVKGESHFYMGRDGGKWMKNNQLLSVLKHGDSIPLSI